MSYRTRPHVPLSVAGSGFFRSSSSRSSSSSITFTSSSLSASAASDQIRAASVEGATAAARVSTVQCVGDGGGAKG